MESPPPNAAPPASKRHIFFTRLASTLTLWAIISVAIWQHQPLIFAGLGCVFGVLTGVEFMRLLVPPPGQRAWRVLGLLAGLTYWAIAIWHLQTRHSTAPLILDLGILIATLQAAFMLTLRHPLDGHTTLLRVFGTVFGVAYTILCYGFLLRLMFFKATATGADTIYLMLYLVMVTKFTDMGAYAIGSLFGKHKMIPHISPAKSWEGFAGAILGAVLASVIMLCWVPDKLLPLTWTHALILVPVLAIVAVVGDLAESVIKRCLAVKDSGHTLPGIGGILDLTDSLLFTAPVFYIFLKFIG